MNTPPDLDALASLLLASSKYRALDLPIETARDLLRREMTPGRPPKAALKAARAKLHTIVAPYLGNPDYPAAERLLADAFASGEAHRVRDACQALLSSHASTRERLPLLQAFYQAVFAITGAARSVLDLACGLNPLALPWMGLPADVRYHAYDLHAPRVALINRFFAGMGMPALARRQDILLEPPMDHAQVAFFFKEAHRFEQRRRGCNREFWLALDCDWLVVTLPAASLSGRHDKRQQHRRLVAETLKGLPWRVSEITVGEEMIFCIDRRAGGGT